MGVLGWCGIKVKSYTVFDRMRKCSPEKIEKRLKKVEKIAG